MFIKKNDFMVKNSFGENNYTIQYHLNCGYAVGINNIVVPWRGDGTGGIDIFGLGDGYGDGTRGIGSGDDGDGFGCETGRNEKE